MYIKEKLKENGLVYKIYFRYRYCVYRIKLRLRYIARVLIQMKRDYFRRIIDKPRTIQLPITYKCNYNCVMCGMHNLISNKDYSVSDLERILGDSLFEKVRVVGINGGEPFLRDDLCECVQVMIEKLPDLKRIYIISNGYFTDSIKTKLENIYLLCKKNDIRVNISFSLDGIGEIQNMMRGHQGAWEKIVNTVEQIKGDKNRYCDQLGLICTVTKKNVYHLEQVEAWSRKEKIDVSYNIATINARIDNFERYEDFSVFSDERALMAAKEFFYKKAMQDKVEKYYGLYLYLLENKRYAYCPCQYNEWVTLVPNGNISYCATYSEELGSALENSAYKLFNDNIEILEEIKNDKCETCSHYIGELSIKGLRKYYRELLDNHFVMF